MSRTNHLVIGFAAIALGLGLTMATKGNTIFYGLVLVGIFRIGRSLMEPGE